jgi:uncharacterized protein (DUF983 family)
MKTDSIRVRPALGPVLLNAVRLRCPNCRKGPVFRGWPNRVLRRCPICGLSYFRESGYYLGGMILTYVFTAFALIATFLFTLVVPIPLQLSQGLLFALWVSYAVLLTLLFVRPAYSLWLSVDFWIGPWQPEP